METVVKGCFFALCFTLCLAPQAPARQTPADSLVSLGRTRFAAGQPEKAIDALRQALNQNPEDLRTLIAVGNAYLEGGRPGNAMRAFKDALELDAASAEAQTGIARVYYQKASTGFIALRNARKAVSEARRATRLDPEYAPAYIVLGRSYERLSEDYAASLRAYVQALALQPDDLETASLLGNAYIELRRSPRQSREIAVSQLDSTTLKRLDRHLDNPRFLPVAAQIFFDWGQAQKAFDTFEKYIQSLPDVEQHYYQDISLVGSAPEIETYARTPEADRKEFLRQFWAKRDLDVLTPVNERLFEHDRRVWYAREHFGRKVAPWDLRGQIYVRYGDPDYRARSGYVNPEMGPAVEQVKERLALALYGPESMDEMFIGPVFPVRSNQSFMGVLNPAELEGWDEGGNILGDDTYLTEAAGGGEDEGITTVEEAAIRDYQRRQMRPANAHTYLPVTTKGDMSVVPWECWVYTNIGEGIEITFTDELNNGIYGYAPVPDLPDEEGSVGLHRYAMLTGYAPHITAARTVNEIPEFYIPGGPMSGLGFSYDFADFRGIDGKTRLEVYYAIDPVEMATQASGDTARILADCSVVLADTAYAQVYRSQDAILFQTLGHPRWPEGAFIPNLIPLDVPPGNYLLTVQVSDRVSKRQSLYRHRLNLEPYGPDSLQISDIQLSWNISEDIKDEKFRKGDLWVIPMTTRAYREDQSAYVYYELYNLSRNAFGQTRYRLTYTIGAEDPKRPFNLVRSSFGALAKLIKKENNTQVRVSFDQTDTEASTTGYFELSLGKVKPGYNRLTVTVEDRNSGQTAAKEILFRYKQ